MNSYAKGMLFVVVLGAMNVAQGVGDDAMQEPTDKTTAQEVEIRRLVALNAQLAEERESFVAQLQYLRARVVELAVINEQIRCGYEIALRKRARNSRN